MHGIESHRKCIRLHASRIIFEGVVKAMSERQESQFTNTWLNYTKLSYSLFFKNKSLLREKARTVQTVPPGMLYLIDLLISEAKICMELGLTGTQCLLLRIPSQQNHLMLREQYTTGITDK